MSVNGANRLGSNSLTELLVFGVRAARSAARFAREQPPGASDALRSKTESERRRIADRFLDNTSGDERVAALRAELNESLEEGAGMFRNESSLAKTCATVEQLKRRLQHVKLADRSRTFNTELIAVLEFENMLDVAEAVAHSALARTESRGAHQRTDFPERDDQRFLAHSLAYRTDGEPKIEHLDVVITRWPPGKRVYGRG